MTAVPGPAKAKGAQRVVEVLDYFDELHQRATVMEISRRYNRPQSSTSELLASLVDLGLLYRDPGSRYYTLTPRAAFIGSQPQPRVVRDGSLALLIDMLRGQTRLGVVLVGMVGTRAQIFRWKPGLRRIEAAVHDLAAGQCDCLCATAAGHMLLSTLAPQRREGLIRRLNAEAAADRKFSPSAMAAQLLEIERRGFAIGPAGFAIDASMTTVLLPAESGHRPMAIGFVHDRTEERDPAALVAILHKTVRRGIVASDGEPGADAVWQALPSVAGGKAGA